MTKQKTFKQKMSNGFMNVFAIAVTLMPLASMGLWAHTTLIDTDRKVYNLDTQVSPEVSPFHEPLVSVTFDDGWESVYTQGTGVLEKYKIPATMYVLSGEEKDKSYMSFAQMRSLREAGYEIGVHGVSHKDMTKLNDAELMFEINASKTTLNQEKLLGHSVSFASPYDAYNDHTIEAISQHYSSQRNTNADLASIGPEDINVGPTLNHYQIIAFAVLNTTTDAQLRSALKYAKDHNGWFVLVYHQIDRSNGQYSVTPEVFDHQMKLVKDSGAKTPTVGTVLSELEVEGL
jgi:peptidoglycan/xylan/chitin deacetylase (PgdA/CDA1 family)